MTPILVNGRKPGASHSLLHGCRWLQFLPSLEGGKETDPVWSWERRDVFVTVPEGQLLACVMG